MAGFAGRALQALRDPWSLLVAAVGAGSAWAVGLPVGAIGIVGVGVLGAAAAVGGAMRSGETGPDASGRTVEPLRPGTVQAGLVDTLDGYRQDLAALRRRTLEPAVQAAADRAESAAADASATAGRVARAVDALDDALGRASGVAQRMPGSAEVRGTVDRMMGRRTALLGRLSSAADEVGEVYAKLLELSTTAGLLGVDTDAATGAADVNDSLDALRGVFEELDSEAVRARTLL